MGTGWRKQLDLSRKIEDVAGSWKWLLTVPHAISGCETIFCRDGKLSFDIAPIVVLFSGVFLILKLLTYEHGEVIATTAAFF